MRTSVNVKVSVMFHGERVYLSVTVVSVELHHLRGVNPRNRILYFTLVSPGNCLASASCFRIAGTSCCCIAIRQFAFPSRTAIFMETTGEKERLRALWKRYNSLISENRLRCTVNYLVINYLAFQSTVVAA